jgi:hypothetical protein
MIHIEINRKAWLALGGDPRIEPPYKIWLNREFIRQLSAYRSDDESWSDLILRAIKELT